ncbi:MAG: chemotaxis protein CheW [Actinomycetota bacterium]
MSTTAARRAAAAADAVAGPDGGAPPDLQLVCFKMGGEEFALGIMRVREIVRPLKVVRVPRSPSFVEGVVNLRGQILPVIDLRRRLGLPHEDDERRTRFLVVALADSVVLFVVDEVNEVVPASCDAVLPAPTLVRGVEASYLLGVLPVGDRLVMLLHPERVLTAAETDELKRLEAEVASSAVDGGTR